MILKAEKVITKKVDKKSERYNQLPESFKRQIDDDLETQIEELIDVLWNRDEIKSISNIQTKIEILKLELLASTLRT
jgi:hypothetical protein